MRYLTVKQAAEIVPYDPQTIKKCCAKTQAGAGELPPLEARKDMRGRWIVTDAALGKWMEAILNLMLIPAIPVVVWVVWEWYRQETYGFGVYRG